MLRLTDFLNQVSQILGHRKHIKELVNYYQSNQEKLVIWANELDQAIDYFNHLKKVPEDCINTIYLKKIWPKFLPKAKQVIAEHQFFEKTLKEMDSFEFFDDEWEIDQLAKACVVAFYRTFMLVSETQLKQNNAQIASVIEEMLALMVLQGEKTELFKAIKFWILDWQKEGFSKQLADRVKNI